MKDTDDPLFRDYKPYDESKVRWRRLNSGAPNAVEMANMDERCRSILESMTLKQYVAAKRGIVLAASEIESVLDEFAVPISGKILEFGAGTCKLAAVLSKKENIESISCLDFSEVLLREIAPRAISYLEGNLDKIDFLVGDMNRIEDVPGEFDWVVCYGAVHHLVEPEKFFSKLKQRLKPNGRVLCLDEPALPELVLPYKELRAYLDSVRQKKSNWRKRKRLSNVEISTHDQAVVQVGGPDQKQLRAAYALLDANRVQGEFHSHADLIPSPRPAVLRLVMSVEFASSLLRCY